MKIAILVAVLLAVVLQEASGALCPKQCTKYKKYNCRYYYYYSYWYGYRRYEYCSSYRRYLSTCYEQCTHGGWSEWSKYDLDNECPVMCGGGKGMATKTRTCTNPAPRNGGNYCSGNDTEQAIIDCNTRECGDLCPSGVDKYHGHPKLDDHFYHCDSGHKKAYLKKCADGAVFDHEKGRCVTDKRDHKCQETGKMYADPQNCGKYLLCVHGTIYEMPCPTGLHFSVYSNTCEQPDDANCQASPVA